jgi:hypothetical protein
MNRIDVKISEDLIPLHWNAVFDKHKYILYCKQDAGFFSNCTVALWNIAEIKRHYGVFPKQIDFTNSFTHYRDAKQAINNDAYPTFFKLKNNNGLQKSKNIPRVAHHGQYNSINYSLINPVVEHYFQASHQVARTEEELIARYKIDLEHTIAIVYRGTDKITEVSLANPFNYLAQARQLLTKNPNFRVWIQTDDFHVRDMFCRELGSQCFYMNEMPVTKENTAIHLLDQSALRMNPQRFGVTLLAVTRLLSKSAFIINHTGNMALWICLYRGHTKNVIQFNKYGDLNKAWNIAFYVKKFARRIYKYRNHQFG